MAPAVGRIPSPSAIHVEVKSDGETWQSFTRLNKTKTPEGLEKSGPKSPLKNGQGPGASGSGL
jgi:hypothetical protein